MDYVLTTNAVSKRYRKIKALDSVTMHIPAGAIYGFVGRNGAGKTTLIRIICGLQEPSAGSFTLYGTPHTESKIAAVRRRVGAIIETPAFYGDMNAVENMKTQYAMLGLPSNDGIDDLLKESAVSNKTFYYDLMGRRVETPVRGIYVEIRNGKARKVLME